MSFCFPSLLLLGYFLLKLFFVLGLVILFYIFLTFTCEHYSISGADEISLCFSLHADIT